MIEDYSEVKNAIEAAGFFTTFAPIAELGDRMVCASRRYETGERAGSLGGNSFWIAKRGNDWFIATWSGLAYRAPSQQQLVALCLEMLSRETSRAFWDSDIDKDTRARFELSPADQELS